LENEKDLMSSFGSLRMRESKFIGQMETGQIYQDDSLGMLR
jgi:hypothetical protein